ncbi:Transposable element Tcb2 transposase, partial [Stegodyphus mimosarum]
MDNNARPHRADIVDVYLESERIAPMAWPAYSPDLNPIENVWDALGRAVSSRFPPSATLIELETTLQEEWRLLNFALVDHLIESMITRSEWLSVSPRSDAADTMNTMNDMETVPGIGSIERKPDQGRPIATTAREYRYLSILARRRAATASQLSQDQYAATGIRVTRVTVSKRLNERGLFARRPTVFLLLMFTDREVRLTWCRPHSGWSTKQWATFLFTDESCFSLNTDSRRTFMWREPKNRYLRSNVREINNYGGGGVMIWAGIMLEGRTPLHVFDRGSVTSVRYRDDVLEPYVGLFRGAVGPEFILQDDNARPRRAFLVDEFLESEDIRRINRPARSPRSREGNCNSQPTSENHP